MFPLKIGVANNARSRDFCASPDYFSNNGFNSVASTVPKFKLNGFETICVENIVTFFPLYSPLEIF